MWNATDGLDVREVCDVLATEEGVDGWKPLEATIDQLHQLARSHSCHRLYLVYEESPEWLKQHNEPAWKFMRDFQMREISADILEKVVFIRVCEKNSVTGPSPILTVNIDKQTLQNDPKKCSLFILSEIPPMRRRLAKRSESPVTTTSQLQAESPATPSHVDILGALTKITNAIKDIRISTKRTSDVTSECERCIQDEIMEIASETLDDV